MSTGYGDTAVAIPGGSYGGEPYGGSGNQQLQNLFQNLALANRVQNTPGGEFANTVNGLTGLASGIGQVGLAGIEIFGSDGALTVPAAIQAAGGLTEIWNSVQLLLNQGVPSTPGTGLTTTQATELMDASTGEWYTAPPAAIEFDSLIPYVDYTVGQALGELAMLLDASKGMGGFAMGNGSFAPGLGVGDSSAIADNWELDLSSPPELGETATEWMNRTNSTHGGWTGDTSGNAYIGYMTPTDGVLALRYVSQAMTDLAYFLSTGGSGITAAEVTTAVWGAVDEYVTDGSSYDQLMAQVAMVAQAMMVGGVRTPDGFFAYVWSATLNIYPPVISVPAFDISAIADTDTLETFLTSQNPDWTVAAGAQPLMYSLTLTAGGPNFSCVCLINDGVFQWLQNYMYTPASGLPKRSVPGDLKTLFALIPVDY